MSHARTHSAFTCEVRPDRERVVVSLSGELDLAGVPEAWKVLDELLQAGFSKLTIDLSALTFLDSEGLRLLVTTSRSAREADCELSLVAGPQQVQRVFALTGLDLHFCFEPRAART